MKRFIHIDILRIIACLLVIFNHTEERKFYRFINDTGVSFVWNYFCSMMCKCGVPIF